MLHISRCCHILLVLFGCNVAATDTRVTSTDDALFCNTHGACEPSRYVWYMPKLWYIAARLRSLVATLVQSSDRKRRSVMHQACALRCGPFAVRQAVAPECSDRCRLQTDSVALFLALARSARDACPARSAYATRTASMGSARRSAAPRMRLSRWVGHVAARTLFLGLSASGWFRI